MSILLAKILKYHIWWPEEKGSEDLFIFVKNERKNVSSKYSAWDIFFCRNQILFTPGPSKNNSVILLYVTNLQYWDRLLRYDEQFSFWKIISVFMADLDTHHSHPPSSQGKDLNDLFPWLSKGHDSLKRTN